MDIKKTKSANLESNRLTYLLIGFVAALSLVYVAFETTDREVQVYDITEEFVDILEDDMIEQTFRPKTPPPPPPPVEVPASVEQIVIVDNDTETADFDVSSEDDQDAVQIIAQAPIEAPIEEEEEIETIFRVVEKSPEFPGGPAELMKYFSNNVRYPVICQENGIQGRVICEFTVWKDGSISDVTVVRSVDKSLDREATRLIEKMPRWKPGQQRGKPVACRFVVPVVFKLQ